MIAIMDPVSPKKASETGQSRPQVPRVFGGAPKAIFTMVMVCLFMAEPLVSAVLLGWLCKLAGLEGRSAIFWISVAPVLYFLWLVLLLGIYTLETSLVGLAFQKPARYHQTVGGTLSPAMFMTVVLYGRGFFVQSLPTVRFMVHMPGMRWLVLRSYSTKTHLGKGCLLTWGITDPDLTFLGQKVVLGDASRIIAHSLLYSPEGYLNYQSAPIEFGEQCVVGGAAQVEMGARIGARAIVEPRSHVLPFTTIPPDEVWGGDPAVFRRKRDGAPEHEAVVNSFDEPELCRLIARALGVAPDEINGASSVTNCLAWDSLGKMAIAAALYDRFGVTLSPEQTFAMNNVSDVERASRSETGESKSSASFELPADPELLALCKPAEAIKALAKSQAQEPAERAKGKPLRVVVAATFVAQPLASSLQLFARAFGIEVTTEFFDFNQVPQALISPQSSLRANREGLNVILVRPEELPGETAKQWLEAIAQFVAETKAPLLVSDVPPRLSGARSTSEEELRLWWRQRLGEIQGVEILGFSEIVEEIGKVAARDVRMEAAASAPFSAAVYQRLGMGIARAVRRMKIPPKKVIAVDCDGTLWGGVVGEDGKEAIVLGGDEAGRGYVALQQELLSLAKRGVLLALVSKNLPEDVWEVLDKHPGMLIRQRDIAAVRINWKAKSENLRELAAELNLGLDSFVFLDDSPVERLEVERNCPGVTVVPLPADASEFADTLTRLWIFDGAGRTREDSQRQQYALQENQRQQARDTANGLESYLSSLELKARLWRAKEEDFPRVSQLTQKTNQFNLSLKRRTLPEIKSLAGDFEIRVISAADRFGDYGMIGVAISRREQDALVLDSLMVSCRVLGRGVEEAFLRGLVEQARSAGAKRLRAPFIEGPRNQPIKEFLSRSGFKANGDDVYELEVLIHSTARRHVKLEMED